MSNTAPQPIPAWAELAVQLVQWRNCMSYNDSYFGEPAGLLKGIAAELERLLPPGLHVTHLKAADPIDMSNAPFTAPKPHKHAALIKQWADDQTLPVWRWANNTSTPGGEWIRVVVDPAWHVDEHYTIGEKPTAPPRRMCTLAGVEFPEPETVAPPNGATYWFADPCHSTTSSRNIWTGDSYDRKWLEVGMVHLNSAAAQAHSRALLAANKQAIEAAR